MWLCTHLSFPDVPVMYVQFQFAQNLHLPIQTQSWPVNYCCCDFLLDSSDPFWKWISDLWTGSSGSHLFPRPHLGHVLSGLLKGRGNHLVRSNVCILMSFYRSQRQQEGWMKGENNRWLHKLVSYSIHNGTEMRTPLIRNASAPSCLSQFVTCRHTLTPIRLSPDGRGDVTTGLKVFGLHSHTHNPTPSRPDKKTNFCGSECLKGSPSWNLP